MSAVEPGPPQDANRTPAGASAAATAASVVGTTTAPLVIDAVVDHRERSLLVAASEQLSESLGAALGRAFAIRLGFRADLAELSQRDGVGVIVASLLPELECDTSLASIEGRWRARLSALSAAATRVFVCTLFRHVPRRDDDPARTLVERIRRLNLLAIELSREFGIGVADIDRVFAHIGARELQTDYRLRGPMAAEVGGYAIVASMLVGLDDTLPADTLERAMQYQGGLQDIGNLIRRRLARGK